MSSLNSSRDAYQNSKLSLVEQSKVAASDSASLLEDLRTKAAISNGRLAEATRREMAAEHETWWKTLRELKDSDNPDDRKTYLVLYSKLQLKILPTTVIDDSSSTKVPTPIAVVNRIDVHVNKDNAASPIDVDVS